MDAVYPSNTSFGNVVRQLTETISEKMPDYHVFVIPAIKQYEEPQEMMQFEVFYEKDFTEIQYEDFKKIIQGSLTNLHL